MESVCHKTVVFHRPQQRYNGAGAKIVLPSVLDVPIVPSAMLSWDFVRDRAIRNLQIENPLHAILSGWFVEPENCGSPASRSWHFQSSCSQSCGRLGVYLTRGEISRGGLGGAHDRTP